MLAVLEGKKVRADGPVGRSDVPPHPPLHLVVEGITLLRGRSEARCVGLM